MNSDPLTSGEMNERQRETSAVFYRLDLGRAYFGTAGQTLGVLLFALLLGQLGFRAEGRPTVIGGLPVQ